MGQKSLQLGCCEVLGASVCTLGTGELCAKRVQRHASSPVAKLLDANDSIIKVYYEGKPRLWLTITRVSLTPLPYFWCKHQAGSRRCPYAGLRVYCCNRYQLLVAWLAPSVLTMYRGDGVNAAGLVRYSLLASKYTVDVSVIVSSSSRMKRLFW